MKQTELTKPPLGVMPRKFWLLDRAKDLGRAINAQLSQGAEGQLNLDLVLRWTSELQKILKEAELESVEF